MPDRQVLLAERYRDALIDVRRKVSARVSQNWARLGSWDDADVPRFLNATLPVVNAGQRRTVSLTDAYVSRLLQRPVVGLDASSLVGAAVRSGADPADVYRRPFVQLWSALSDGRPFPDALNAAGARLDATAQTDISLSMRASADEIAILEPRITGWERTLDGDACDFCVLISDRVYKTALLAPVHDRCNCGIAPVYGAPRVGKAINGDRIAALRERTDAPAAAIHEHGELGAVVGDASHSFTSATDLQAA